MYVSSLNSAVEVPQIICKHKGVGGYVPIKCYLQKQALGWILLAGHNLPTLVENIKKVCEAVVYRVWAREARAQAPGRGDPCQ